MAKTQQPFKGAPRIGPTTAPGEPADSPVASGVAGFSGAPTFGGGIENRGEKVVNPNPASEHFPLPYGGGEPVVHRPNQKSAKGSGDGTGVGATSGSTQHSGAGIP